MTSTEMRLLGVFLSACCACACVASGLRSQDLAQGADRAALWAQPRRFLRAARHSECGVRGPRYETLIAGGEEANVGEFPWHAGVYRFVVNRPRVQECGGTLLTSTLVITAAHCFWDESTKQLKPHTLYKIALGKHLRDWEQQEQGLQTRDVAKISIPKRYRGRGSRFQYDVAVVKMASRVDFSETVRPICVDWNKQFENQQLKTGQRGISVGWGVTLNETAAVVLQKVSLPFVDFDTCFNALPENAKSLYTDDKFCAGFANKSTSVCPGDSGGGLVFSDANDRYYLQGVVSVSFKPEDDRDACYSQLYTGFTLVSHYLSWIKTFVDAEGGARVTTTERPKQKSTIEKMCEAYSSVVYESVQLPSSATQIQVSTCAMSPSGISTQRLLSQPREFPHVAALGYVHLEGVKWSCVGSLISERFVLTVAHCTQPRAGELKWVRLGSVKLYVNNTDQGLVHMEVDEVIRHPSYRTASVYNDVALLRLKEDVVFNGYVRPACLDPHPGTATTGLLTGASWGKPAKGAPVYDGLQNGDTRVADSASCIRKFANISTSRLKNGIDGETQLCVTTLDANTDCALLSGSPIMAKLSTPFCMYRIVGIISFGLTSCGETETTPTVATRVGAFAQWIETIVWPQEKNTTSVGAPSKLSTGIQWS